MSLSCKGAGGGVRVRRWRGEDVGGGVYEGGEGVRSGAAHRARAEVTSRHGHHREQRAERPACWAQQQSATSAGLHGRTAALPLDLDRRSGASRLRGPEPSTPGESAPGRGQGRELRRSQDGASSTCWSDHGSIPSAVGRTMTSTPTNPMSARSQPVSPIGSPSRAAPSITASGNAWTTCAEQHARSALSGLAGQRTQRPLGGGTDGSRLLTATQLASGRCISVRLKHQQLMTSSSTRATIMAASRLEIATRPQPCDIETRPCTATMPTPSSASICSTGMPSTVTATLLSVSVATNRPMPTTQMMALLMLSLLVGKPLTIAVSSSGERHMPGLDGADRRTLGWLRKLEEGMKTPMKRRNNATKFSGRTWKLAHENALNYVVVKNRGRRERGQCEGFS